MAIKRVQLDYRPAVEKRPPERTIPIPANEWERLDKGIKQKTENNAQQMEIAQKKADQYLVR